MTEKREENWSVCFNAALEAEKFRDEIKELLKRQGAPTLAELTERFKNWNGPEVSGSIVKRK